jgi:ATP phosphoribosyltransferase regulatory subunit
MLHTPEGVRDIYNGECRLKQGLEQGLHQVFHLYGFEDIETPTFEFFDIFNKERGTIPSREMYKLFDREGNTLVLRPDLTPSIARCAAKYFKEETLPIRLCYSGSTFINNESHKGKLNEVTQLGAELINDGSIEADAEMLALTVEALKAAHLTQFQVEVGHAGFLNGLLEEAACTLEERMEIKTLLESKNIFGMEEFLEKRPLPAHLKELFLLLPELFGGIEDLEKVEDKVKNEQSLEALARLKKLHTLLGFYGLGNYITFDLGMLSRYDYYTGIILNAYTYGTGEPVAKGGRYDSLVGQFGKDAPAIGVAIVADQLLLALERQKKVQKEEADLTVLLYTKAKSKEAISMAQKLRKSGKKVSLTGILEKEKEELVKTYQENRRIEKLIVL